MNAVFTVPQVLDDRQVNRTCVAAACQVGDSFVDCCNSDADASCAPGFRHSFADACHAADGTMGTYSCCERITEESTEDCVALPIVAVSTISTPDLLAVEWSFEAESEGPVTVQVSVHGSGDIDMHIRVTQSSEHAVTWNPGGIYGESEHREESIASYSSNLGFEYLASDPCVNGWTGVGCGTSLWPPGQDDCERELSCASLRWNPDTNGHPDVCGSSALRGVGGCGQLVKYDTALELCASLGARLCTAEELLLNEGDAQECELDSPRAWSWTHSDICPEGEALAAAGQSGDWFQFNVA
eukprot:COSAG02_NODE_448_length_22102_cov_11.767032_1_plen_298_part_10